MTMGLFLYYLLFRMVAQWIGRALETTGHFGHKTQVTCFIVPFFLLLRTSFQDVPRCGNQAP